MGFILSFFEYLASNWGRISSWKTKEKTLEQSLIVKLKGFSNLSLGCLVLLHVCTVWKNNAFPLCETKKYEKREIGSPGTSVKIFTFHKCMAMIQQIHETYIYCNSHSYTIVLHWAAEGCPFEVLYRGIEILFKNGTLRTHWDCRGSFVLLTKLTPIEPVLTKFISCFWSQNNK